MSKTATPVNDNNNNNFRGSLLLRYRTPPSAKCKNLIAGYSPIPPVHIKKYCPAVTCSQTCDCSIDQHGQPTSPWFGSSVNGQWWPSEDQQRLGGTEVWGHERWEIRSQYHWPSRAVSLASLLFFFIYTAVVSPVDDCFVSRSSPSLSEHRVALVCSARSSSTKAEGTTNRWVTSCYRNFTHRQHTFCPWLRPSALHIRIYPFLLKPLYSLVTIFW